MYAANHSLAAGGARATILLAIAVSGIAAPGEKPRDWSDAFGSAAGAWWRSSCRPGPGCSNVRREIGEDLASFGAVAGLVRRIRALITA
jgi:hypothetical protein